MHHLWFLRGQKKASDTLELELQIVMSCYVGAVNQTWVLCKSSKGSYPLSHLASASHLILFFNYQIVDNFLHAYSAL